jgi:ribonuclease G
VKRLLISKDRHETRAALLDDGQLSEFFVERPGRLSLVGNIYKGRVENVLAGMDAAFVDIGMERNGYLYVDEVVSADAGPGGNRKITDLLRSGREVLVQVTRDGMGSKGPRLTTQID